MPMQANGLKLLEISSDKKNMHGRRTSRLSRLRICLPTDLARATVPYERKPSQKREASECNFCALPSVKCKVALAESIGSIASHAGDCNGWYAGWGWQRENLPGFMTSLNLWVDDFG